jgi:hypothetical protein
LNSITDFQLPIGETKRDCLYSGQSLKIRGYFIIEEEKIIINIADIVQLLPEADSEMEINWQESFLRIAFGFDTHGRLGEEQM